MTYYQPKERGYG